eukprot:TRINITY_DN17214_c0_g1_i1.p1 TRINITY_DN17214_c0_g1~~TRINITY_DN17214_c0_g1_i1.p1  ORF type:complete len:166 (-),score=28.82 TRINITY_DN17214_c0_g1_i1:51-548(-)
MGAKPGILSDEDLCHSHRCRDNVAQAANGEMKFVIDRWGSKWKCVNRRYVPGEPGPGWACAELQCMSDAPVGLLMNSFHGKADCNFKITTEDGAEAQEAPVDSTAYEAVPRSGLEDPPKPGQAAMPCPLLAPPQQLWPQAFRQAEQRRVRPRGRRRDGKLMDEFL